MKPFLLRLVACLFVVISSSSHAALYDRGNGLIYDDVLDITWMQDANYAQTSGFDADGLMYWAYANFWADQLQYGGSDDWRLASAKLGHIGNMCTAFDGSCDTGYNITTSELGHMFYNNLGNLGYSDATGNLQSGYGISNVSFTDATLGGGIESIVNLQHGVYWFAENPPIYHPWSFDMQNGVTVPRVGSSSYAWAVHDGDIGAAVVPIPAAAWLFGSALAGLLVARRTNKK